MAFLGDNSEGMSPASTGGVIIFGTNFESPLCLIMGCPCFILVG